MKINNIDIISELLGGCLELNDFFIKVEIIRRKKDGGNSSLSCNEKVIKSYYINNIESLKFILDSEIIPICEALNARAYINPNIKSYKNAGIETASYILKLLRDGMSMKSCKTAFDKVASLTKTCGKKYWVVDADKDNREDNRTILNYFLKNNLRFGVIPTPNGEHYLCEPFNIKDLRDNYKTTFKSGTYIHKQGLTILYSNLK